MVLIMRLDDDADAGDHPRTAIRRRRAAPGSAC
jgi:hypothetical protein